MSWGKCAHSMCAAVPLKTAGMGRVEGNAQLDGVPCRTMLTRSDITFTGCQAHRLGVSSGQNTVSGRIKLFCRNGSWSG